MTFHLITLEYTLECSSALPLHQPQEALFLRLFNKVCDRKTDFHSGLNALTLPVQLIPLDLFSSCFLISVTVYNVCHGKNILQDKSVSHTIVIFKYCCYCIILAKRHLTMVKGFECHKDPGN